MNAGISVTASTRGVRATRADRGRGPRERVCRGGRRGEAPRMIEEKEIEASLA